jgi:hypothetical protein
VTDVLNLPTEGDNDDQTPDDNSELWVGDGDSFFSAVMGTVENPEAGEAAAEGGETTPPAAGGDGSPAPEGEGAEAGSEEPGSPTAGAGGESDVASGSTPEFTRDAAEYEPEWVSAIEGIESRQREDLTRTAVEEVKTEYAQYVDAVNAAPRYLVGRRVPRADGTEGEELLSDAADARDWQEEIKRQLANEVNRRVQLSLDANAGTMEVIHNSIELFRGNPDILPGAKQFDRELADNFAELIAPYAVKSDSGETQGWSIDVKPLLQAARTRLAATRAAAAAASPAASSPAATAAPTPQQQRAAAQPRDEAQRFTQQPQVGIQSQAGQSGDEGENLDTLFGTLGIAPGTFRF